MQLFEFHAFEKVHRAVLDPSDRNKFAQTVATVEAKLVNMCEGSQNESETTTGI